jgi:hypothetical protein
MTWMEAGSYSWPPTSWPDGPQPRLVAPSCPPQLCRGGAGTAETGRRYLDNLYGAFGVGVELDGQAYRPAETRWDDLHRDNYCAVVGLIILRYSWTDVTERRCSTAAELARVLSQRGWPGPLRRCAPSCTAALP